MKVIIPIQRTVTPPPKENKTLQWCEREGCQAFTYNKKPYCTDHVDEMPYVKMMKEKTSTPEEDMRSIMALKVCETLQQVAMDLHLKYDAAEKLISGMSGYEIVKHGKGKMVVKNDCR